MSRVIVKYDEWGRMGNRMFLYAFGRILASKKQCELFVDPIPNFMNTFNHKKVNEAGELVNPIYTKETYGTHFADMDELLSTDRDIVVNSFLQRSEYYTDNREEIKQYFELDTIPCWQMPSDNELVVHIRETDYKQIGKWLNEEFYIDQIRKLGFRNTTIVTDNCNSDFIKNLSDAGCKVLSDEPVSEFKIENNDSIMQDYIYMLYADHLLLSQSTFSWWPAFLGDHKQILFPVSDNKNSMWLKEPGKNNVDLFVNNGIYKKVLI